MEHEFLIVETHGHKHTLPLDAVREIFSLGPVTPVPGAPSEVAGLCNLRGHIITLLDLGRVLGLGNHRLRIGDPVVLVEASNIVVGLLVDNVIGIHRNEVQKGGNSGSNVSGPSVPLLDISSLILEVRRRVTQHAQRILEGHEGKGRCL